MGSADHVGSDHVGSDHAVPPALSVVIPTRDRRARLEQTLAALAESAPASGGALEVVVVDDGSTDDTADFLAQARHPFALQTFSQTPAGPAKARNRGIAAAAGERILLLGDDTRPAPGSLGPHLPDGPASEASRPVAVQGLIDWDPMEEITPLMHFLAPSGPQFYFEGLTPGNPVPYTAVLGSNFSAPRQWFIEEPFDETFPHAALEDTELAYRWQCRNWQTLYAPDALCWHHHRYDSLEPFLARQKRAGAATRHAVRKHPRLWLRLVAQPFLYGLYAQLRYRTTRDNSGVERQRRQWDLACRQAFFAGYRQPR